MKQWMRSMRITEEPGMSAPPWESNVGLEEEQSQK
jgi:hypothetical protein